VSSRDGNGEGRLIAATCAKHSDGRKNDGEGNVSDVLIPLWPLIFSFLP
jgi:hypothetical protein